MQRINTFLEEENVPDWACSLTRPINIHSNHETSERIGFENATLEWYFVGSSKVTTDAPGAAAQVIEDEDCHHRLDIGELIPPLDDQMAPTLVDGNSEYSPTLDGPFENARAALIESFKLQNINVFMPPGELTLVTGITGAGKTAFLVALLGGKYLIAPSVHWY
jgi:ABC-type multidrug transport system fused ATPase/permease subunit